MVLLSFSCLLFHWEILLLHTLSSLWLLQGMSNNWRIASLQEISGGSLLGNTPGSQTWNQGWRRGKEGKWQMVWMEEEIEKRAQKGEWQRTRNYSVRNKEMPKLRWWSREGNWKSELNSIYQTELVNIYWLHAMCQAHSNTRYWGCRAE